MTKISRPKVTVGALAPFVQKAEAMTVRAKATAMSGLVDHIASAPKGVDPAIAKRYQDARAQGDFIALQMLIDDVPPVDLEKHVSADPGVQTTQGLWRSYKALIDGLAASPGWGVEVDAAKLPDQYFVRKKMLDDVVAVKKAVDAAGPCTATAQFPTAQLASLEKDLRADLSSLSEVRDEAISHARAPMLRMHDLSSPDQLRTALTRVLGDEHTAQALVDGADKVQGADAKAAYKKSLAAFTILVDQATAAPDYANTKMGWQYPQSRSEYRARLFDPWVQYASKDRQHASLDAAKQTAVDVAKAADPKAALDTALVQRFLVEVSADAKAAATWKPTAAGVADAMAKEVFLPLRALNETIKDMAQAGASTTHQGPAATARLAAELEPKIRGFVNDVTRHVAEGDYTQWRYENPASKVQLSSLSKEQLAAWQAPHGIESWAAAGKKLKTREEDGAELMWVTKIGGPSHGFDYGGNCLMPLLGNGRTKTILVEDPRWTHNAAARCYLRMLPGTDGKPTLYMEPNQRDFPHRKKFDTDKQTEGLEWESAQVALVKHAIDKAKTMGLPLSLPDYLGGTLDSLGIDAKFEHRQFVLEPSAGLFEASDTLGIGHDWLNTERQTTPHLGRFVVYP